MNPSERILSLFTDPALAVAIIGAAVAFGVEFVRRGAKKANGEKPEGEMKTPITTGQEIPAYGPIDHVSGRIEDLKQMLKNERSDNQFLEKEVDRWQAKAQQYLMERNAAWDRLRTVHHEEPPYRADRSIAQVLPDENAVNSAEGI